MTLTSRERVNRALERRDHDRVPRHESFWRDTLTRWEKEGLAGGETEALERLGSDFQFLSWYWPQPFPDRNEKVAEDEETVTFIDANGATLRYFKNRQTTPEHFQWECDSAETWHARFRDRYLSQDLPLPGQLEAIRERGARGARLGLWRFFASVEPFEVCRALLGDVSAMIAIADDPEWIRDIAEVSTDLTLRNHQALLDAGVEAEGLWIYGDMAFNHATFCSPAAYRALVWPSHQRLCQWAHERGMKFIYHTDGDINGVMDLYLEAGFDALQPLECKANVDIRRLAPRYGDRVTFFGNVDVMKMIPNDLDLIEEEIRAKFAAGMERRGYIYHSDHSIPPQVSWPTYQALIRLVQRHGQY